MDGECTADLCPAGQVFSGGECVEDLCPDGQVFSGGECVDELLCGDGTVAVGGECVPEDDLCADGQAWVGGECVEIATCGAGTLLVAGECRPVDPFDDADLLEGAEPNDLPFDGEATAFTLPAEGSVLLLGGHIGPAADMDGLQDAPDPDFDSWVFQGQAGQRLQIEAIALGVPSVAFHVHYLGSDAVSPYQRFALGIGSRNATRQVVLPRDGEYELLIGDRGNLLSIYSLTLDVLGNVGLEPILTGREDYSYLVGVSIAADPTPATHTASFTASGDLTALPVFDLPDSLAGRPMLVSLVGNSRGVFPSYTLSDPETGRSLFDNTSFLFRFPPGEFFPPPSPTVPVGLHRVPEGGARLTVDYLLAAATDTGFQLEVTFETAGRQFAMDTALWLYDDEANELYFDDDSADFPYSRLTATLAPGAYLLRVATSPNQFAPTPGFYTLRVNVEPKPVCGNGVVEEGEACDDNNFESGDGCSEDAEGFCSLEYPGFDCSLDSTMATACTRWPLIGGEDATFDPGEAIPDTNSAEPLLPRDLPFPSHGIRFSADALVSGSLSGPAGEDLDAVWIDAEGGEIAFFFGSEPIVFEDLPFAAGISYITIYPGEFTPEEGTDWTLTLESAPVD